MTRFFEPLMASLAPARDVEELNAALDGVDLDATPDAIIERVTAAVNEADPINLMGIGLPEDEYAPEIAQLAALAHAGRLTDYAAWLVFACWFSAETAPAPDAEVWQQIASMR